MGNRRFTRLTKAFSKKLENHSDMLAVSFINDNFCRKLTTTRTTPAGAAQVADHQWTLEEVVEMIDAHHEEKLNAEYEAAFAAKFTPARKFPKTDPPQKPKTPWYLQRFAGGETEIP